MTAGRDEREDSPALSALAELGRDAFRPHTQAELDEGLDALRRRLATARKRRRALGSVAALGVAAACVAIALHLAGTRATRAPVPEPPISVARIEGGNLLEGGYLSQSGRAGVTVLFSEGSKFALRPGTRGRIRAVEKDGARMAIEHGTASLRVTQNRQHRWFVEAGPFLVTVKGTVFTVSWDPSSERFELMLQHGRVVVSGPDGDIPLRAGQHLVVSLPRAETLITEEPSTANLGTGSDAPPAVAVSAGPVSTPRVTTARAAASPRPTPPSVAKVGGGRRWAAELARGSWDGILAHVDRDGVDATLETASSEDLFALADAARYRRRTDLARAALVAQRRRFPHDARALDAIFLLGRVEELRAQGAAAAIAWYDEYLAKAPNGAFAAEALGRKMILTNERDGGAAARPIAEEYLRRFPAGSYAGSARALQRAP